MADKPLYDYQVRLQNDPNELAEFRKGGQAARNSMTKHGVPIELHDAMLSKATADRDTIVAAAHHEIEHGGAPPSFASCIVEFDEPAPEDDKEGERN